MSHVDAIHSLRISQGIFTAVNLALASYLFHSSTQSTQSTHYPSGDIAVSLAAACASAIGVCCAPVQSNPSPRRSPKLFVAFAIDWVVALINLAALVALALFTTQSYYCSANTCTVMKVNAVFTGFNFTNWAATATFLGMRLSKKAKRVTMVLPSMEKVPY
ncbi:MARVEL-like domain [Pyrenophora seminiperda CCB06]|uniref:MARVEL-like domain n=1 Tax=Pyrenophora seminiperda CCB06 TaxID=1302712 RepID=A0A3M7MBM5_9PLEO|nr:MARVEL-like domain [Pyrenophora seminiperda CCB06]